MDYKKLKLSSVSDMVDNLINTITDANEGLNRTYIKSINATKTFETVNITVSKYEIEIIRINS